jgi:sulfate transport system substrate-binding protein
MNGWYRILKGPLQIFQGLRGWGRFSSTRRFLSLVLVGVGLTFAIAACSGGTETTSTTSPGASPVANQKQDVELTLVSFAVTKDAHDAIIPKFVEKWKQEKGQNVTVTTSYGGSGSQTRAVIDGLEADVVHLALALDTEKLVKAGLIEQGWEQETPNNGIVAKSVAALVTRDGNPKNIKSFGDLAKPDVKWITADPKTSGIARWNFLTLWNYAMKTGGGNQAKAEKFMTQAFNNVPVLTKDAREASDVFLTQGQGDALVNYENEILLAQKKKGEKLSYTIPEVNLSIDTPVAVVDKYVDKRGTREVAEAFVKFLYTPEAQEEFVKAGFRPVNEAVAKNKALTSEFPPVKTLGTVQDYGGWNEVQKKFFADGAFFDQMQAGKK